MGIGQTIAIWLSIMEERKMEWDQMNSRFHCEIWVSLSMEITSQASAKSALLHCCTVTEGEKIIDLLNWWAFAWLRAQYRAYFSFLCIHSASTAVANRWNKFCGWLSRSDQWGPWPGRWFWAHGSPEEGRELLWWDLTTLSHLQGAVCEDSVRWSQFSPGELTQSLSIRQHSTCKTIVSRLSCLLYQTDLVPSPYRLNACRTI